MADDAEDDHSEDEIPVADSGRFLRMERKFQQWEVHLFGLHGKGGRLDRMEATMASHSQMLETQQKINEEQRRWAWKTGAIAGAAVVVATVAIQIVKLVWP